MPYCFECSAIRQGRLLVPRHQHNASRPHGISVISTPHKHWVLSTDPTSQLLSFLFLLSRMLGNERGYLAKREHATLVLGGGTAVGFELRKQRQYPTTRNPPFRRKSMVIPCQEEMAKKTSAGDSLNMIRQDRMQSLNDTSRTGLWVDRLKVSRSCARQRLFPSNTRLRKDQFSRQWPVRGARMGFLTLAASTYYLDSKDGLKVMGQGGDR